ncbi:MAG TPA: hypothetical protein VIX35_09840 [Vicinamibacterales bacterium]
MTDGARPVPEMGSGDFEVRDNGTIQTVTDLTVHSLPIDVTILFQFSASGPQFVRVRTALGRAIASLRPVDQYRLLTADMSSVHGSGWASGPASGLPVKTFDAPSWSTRPLNNGMLYEGLALALATRSGLDRRHLGLLITDPVEDGLSFVDVRALTDAARYTDLVLSVVLTEDPGLEAVKRPEERQSSVPEAVRTLAELTGGQFLVRKNVGDDLGQAAVDALETFKSSYVLAFTPSDRSHPGWHDLNVKVVKPGAAHFTVIARRGYMEPGVARDR